jgi:hypothetical protein
MKGGQNLAYLQQKKKEQEINSWIHPCTCMVCGKSVEGYHARFGEEGVCNSDCMKVQDAKEKFPEHPAIDFERRYNL